MTDVFKSAEEIIQLLAEPKEFERKLGQLKDAVESADRKLVAALKLDEKYKVGDELFGKATAMLNEVKTRASELDEREAAIKAGEKDLLARQKALAEREAVVISRERHAERRHASLTEIARAAAR